MNRTISSAVLLPFIGLPVFSCIASYIVLMILAGSNLFPHFFCLTEPVHVAVGLGLSAAVLLIGWLLFRHTERRIIAVSALLISLICYLPRALRLDTILGIQISSVLNPDLLTGWSSWLSLLIDSFVHIHPDEPTLIQCFSPFVFVLFGMKRTRKESSDGSDGSDVRSIAYLSTEDRIRLFSARLKKLILPALTALVVLIASLLPQRLSNLQMQQLVSHVHTEKVTREARIPLQANLSQRLILLARWKTGDESVTGLYQNAESEEQDPEMVAKVATAVEALSTKVSFFSDFSAVLAEGYSTQILLLQDADTGMNARILQIESGWERPSERKGQYSPYQNSAQNTLYLDEDSLLFFELHLRDTPNGLKERTLEQFTMEYLGYLGQEVGVNWPAEDEHLFFQLDNGVLYRVSLDDPGCSLEPWEYESSTDRVVQRPMLFF